MRIHTQAGRGFLGYCANVHPGETLDEVLDAARRHGAGVRRTLETDELAYGLWLSRSALDEVRGPRRGELRRTLDDAGLCVVTMNGFPYGNFHARTVKRKVYHPDLSSLERSAYLLELAQLLSELLPDDATEGTISTLPISHRDEPADDVRATDVREAAAARLGALCEDLARLRDRTGKSIRICLEPEPGCQLETTEDAVAFFTQHLPDAAARARVDWSLIQQHLGLCYDTCHQAICFEDPATSLAELQRAGIRIGKVQLSSALELRAPADPDERRALVDFAEPRFLHQVRTRGADGRLLGVDDLEYTAELPTANPWRVHFHVPIHLSQLGPLRTTRGFIEQLLPLLAADPAPPHMEIETYTWSVLPRTALDEVALTMSTQGSVHDAALARDSMRDATLTRGLATEIAFARERLR
jgi:sugar phosphate isomerase/epimerase